MKKWISLIVLIVIVFFAGWWLSGFFHKGGQTASSKAAQKPLYWRAPMNPGYRSDKPGKSPMGMDLVPVYASAEGANDSSVKISPAVEQSLGVRTAIVKKQSLSRNINTVGYVEPDENKIQTINTYVDGWVKKLLVKTTGEVIKKNQLLFQLYSPKLVNAEEEYLLALKYNNQLLVRAGKQKLITLGMTDNEIAQLKTSRKVENTIGVYATQDGFITKLNIREGMHVKPATSLMTIADLSQIWVIAEVYEQQSAWVKVGQKVVATFSYLPGKTYIGVVDYIYPELDPKTHTVRVRLVFANPKLQLKPDMYANVTIAVDAKDNVLAIPKEALIRTNDGDRVVIALGEGRFRPQPVKIGMENKDWAAVLSGLKAGDKVVTSAQFLLDSESALKAGLSRINAEHSKHKKVQKN